MIRIFHTADLHLDSPFSSLPPSQSETRRKELRCVFTDMMNYARKCDLILIPGDLFDGEYAGRETAELLCSAFGKLERPVVIAPGNHDPYTEGSVYMTTDFPDNVHIFKSETPSHFDFDDLNVSVWGSAFLKTSMKNTILNKIPQLPRDRVNILCQHADTKDPLSNYCPVNPRDIAYKGFAYGALGHIHIPPEPCVYDSKTTVAYPGCPLGRSFDEPGFGSALYAEISDDGTVTLERVRFAKSRYMVENTDITGTDNYVSACEKISAMIKDKSYGEETSLRVIMRGEVPPSLSLPLGTMTKLCESGLGYLELRDKTLPLYDTERLERDITIRGAFFRELLPRLTSGEERERTVAAEALRTGLAAIDNRSIFPDKS